MHMKALSLLTGAIAVVVAATPMMPAFSQSAPGAQPPANGRWMKGNRLNLTDAQKAQMKQIQESARQQMDAVFTPEQKEQMRLARQNRQRPNLNLTDAQKAQLKAIQDQIRSQMDAILTPEQKQQMQAQHQQMRQRHQQHQEQESGN